MRLWYAVLIRLRRLPRTDSRAYNALALCPMAAHSLSFRLRETPLVWHM